MTDSHTETTKPPPPANPRWFGVGAGIVFLVIACIVALRCGGRVWPLSLGGVGILFFGTALSIPQALVPIQRVWRCIGWGLNWFNTRLLLALVFYVVITPTSLILRLFRKDPMDRRWRDRECESYWTGRSENESQDMRRQF